MSFTAAVRSYLVNFAKFQGRASRSEFWFSTLFACIVLALATVTDRYAGLMLALPLAMLGLTLPQLSVHARRLHDTDVSAWWLALPPGITGLSTTITFLAALNSADPEKTVKLAAPVMGQIDSLAFTVIGLLMAWSILGGTSGPNSHGADPLARRPRSRTTSLAGPTRSPPVAPRPSGNGSAPRSGPFRPVAPSSDNAAQPEGRLDLARRQAPRQAPGKAASRPVPRTVTPETSARERRD